MRIFSLALGFLPLVAGHTLMTTLYVDGENQGDGVCIRMNRNAEKATFPISPLANDAMACGAHLPLSILDTTNLRNIACADCMDACRL